MRSAPRLLGTGLLGLAYLLHTAGSSSYYDWFLQTHNLTAPPSGECYRDSDCQFFQKDSSGLISGEIVGTCVKRSESLSMCKCIEGYTGKNCEFKLCPISLNTDLMCNGVQGEGDDYYGPLKGSYMGSEWNTYDQVDPVEFVPTQQSAAVGGLCDFTSGRCSCHAGWSGPACDLRECPHGTGHGQEYPVACSGQGLCIEERDGQNFVCECFDNFHGIDCSKRHCPNSTRGYICDDRGTCDSATGFCVCDEGYYGPDCTLKKCPVVNGRVCNGQGVCHASTFDGVLGTMSEGNFTDYEGKKHNAAPVTCDDFVGATVSMPDGTDTWTCRSFTGQKQGVCACRWPYYGDDCTLKLCPNSTSNSQSGSGLQCDGHGSCDASSGSCVCDAGYFGPDCHKRVCPFSSNNQWGTSLECNGEGDCDREWGTCECKNRRYWGKACEKLRCPSYPSDVSNGIMSKHTETSHDMDGYRAWPDECGGEAQGDCDTNTGKCICHAGFFGYDCSQRGVGDGTTNRRLHLNFNEGRSLRPDGTLSDAWRSRESAYNGAGLGQ